MANQSKLKAWVRYDGTGRVISGGPIFQVNKPKVGNWKQIDANLCCNSTLTTTTTTQGGGGTPTAWIGRMTTDLLSVCDSGSNLWYTAGPVIDGQIVYQDASLTNPYTENGLLISTAGYYYQLNGVGLATLLGSCPIPNQESYAAGFVSSTVCESTGPYSTIYYSGTLGNGTALYTDAGLTAPYNPGLGGTYVRIYFQAAYQVCTMNGNVIQSYTAC